MNNYRKLQTRLPIELRKCASCKYYKNNICKNKLSKHYGINRFMDASCNVWNNMNI